MAAGTEAERFAFVALFGGLALLALRCPCDAIFACKAGLVSLLLEVAGAWIAYRALWA